jgi:uncharacterized protein (DUF2147 family)
MKKSILTFVTTLVIGIVTLFAQSAKLDQGDAILGEWVNEKKDTKFQIFKKDNKYFGKVIWGTGGETKDVKNPDEKLRNREVIGLTILNNFVFNGEDTWGNGTIYDPREGKTYSCKITQKGKDKINVRGYIGVSMFGRTEVWTRIK